MEYSYEIPWCYDCRDWHFGAVHTRQVASSNTGSTNTNWTWNIPPPRSAPTVQQDKVSRALEVLELGPDASKSEARDQFRALIKLMHPDHGGDAEDAKRLLAARDTLRKVGRM